MELFAQSTDKGVHMNEKFRAFQSLDICKQIFLYLSSYNFVQEFTT
jgi:hypothetical protein